MVQIVYSMSRPIKGFCALLIRVWNMSAHYTTLNLAVFCFWFKVLLYNMFSIKKIYSTCSKFKLVSILESFNHPDKLKQRQVRVSKDHIDRLLLSCLKYNLTLRLSLNNTVSLTILYTMGLEKQQKLVYKHWE